MKLVLIVCVMVLSWLIVDEILIFFKIDLVRLFYKIGLLSQADYKHYLSLPRQELIKMNDVQLFGLSCEVCGKAIYWDSWIEICPECVARMREEEPDNCSVGGGADELI